MARTILLSFLIAVVLAAPIVFWEESRSRALQTVEQKLAQMPQQTLSAIRFDPEEILAQVKQQNYPMLLAFLDLDAAVTQTAVDNYGIVFDGITSQYTSSTRQQIAEAVFRVHEAESYYPGLSYLDCLNLLHETPSGRFANVAEAAKAVYEELQYTAMKPQLDAQAAQLEANAQQEEYHRQMQALFSKNLALVQARLVAVNAAKAEQLAASGRAHQAAEQKAINDQERMRQEVNWYRGGWGYYGW